MSLYWSFTSADDHEICLVPSWHRAATVQRPWEGLGEALPQMTMLWWRFEPMTMRVQVECLTTRPQATHIDNITKGTTAFFYTLPTCIISHLQTRHNGTRVN